MLGERETISRDRGIFLPTTWRLSPAISEFTSQVFYESRLTSKPGLEKHALVGVDGLDGSGLWYLDVDHDGRTSASDEEVDAVAELFARLLAPGGMWISETGSKSQLTPGDILVVSPVIA